VEKGGRRESFNITTNSGFMLVMLSAIGDELGNLVDMERLFEVIKVRNGAYVSMVFGL